MKMTVVLDERGELVAAQHRDRGQEAGLVAGPKQKLHEVEVPDEVAAIEDAHQFMLKIKPHLPKA